MNRLWRVVQEQAERRRSDDGVDTPLARKAHATIAKVTDDIDRRFVFNTPIAAVMELVNEIVAGARRPGGALRGRDRGLADPAVRAARRRGAVGAARATSACGRQPWPVADAALLEHETIEVVVQVNGKVRDRLRGRRGDRGGRAGRAGARVGAGRAHLNGGEPRKTIVVPRQARQLRRVRVGAAAER